MKKHLVLAAMSMMVVAPTLATTSADAQRHRTYRDRAYNDRYYQDCKRSSGTTGAIAGGAGGALAGHVLGGGTLGTIAGGVGGALLGRHLDKKHDAAQNRRNGC